MRLNPFRPIDESIAHAAKKNAEQATLSAKVKKRVLDAVAAEQDQLQRNSLGHLVRGQLLPPERHP